MTFLDLYGEAVSHELGSEDVAQLFTTQRRKNAVNRAAKEFQRLTHLVLSREVSVPLVTGTARYDLDAATTDRFISFNRTPMRLERTRAGVVSATEVPQKTPAWLDVHQEGWRDLGNKGAPQYVALDGVNGVNWLQVTPNVQVDGAETWALVVPFNANAGNMGSDTDEPFDGRPDVEPFHWALAHFAAAILERLRKDADAEKTQIAKFGAYVEDWNASRKPRGQRRQVSFQRNYYGESSRTRGAIVQGDPRT